MATNLNITNIPAPRVPFIDARTGLMSREWYRFFLNLFVLTGSGTNPTTLDELQIGPPNQPDLTELLIQINQNIAPQYEDQSGDFLATLDTAQLMSMMARFENAEAAIQGAYLQPVVQTGTIANYNLDSSPTAGGVVYGTGPALAVSAAGTLGQVLISGVAGSPTWSTDAGGSVTSVSVVSANGLAGTVATATTTPAITLSTTITGLLKGNGTAISAAASGTDYAPATSGTSILYGNGSGGFSNVTIGTGVAFAGGTLSATGSGGTVTSVTGTAPVVSSGGATPAISMAAATTSVNGYLTSTDWTTFNNKGNGTVTSVSWTGGIVSVATATTTPAFTIAGTSGGIPYFSNGTTWASSAALAAGSLVLGGGAGVTPATTTTGTGVVTALGVNTGTAGAFVVNGGALGTPSSGTVTNLTGTASININGTVGATTANTASVTTLNASGAITGSSTGNSIVLATSYSGTGYQFQRYQNGASTGDALLGINNSGAGIGSGGTAYGTIIGSFSSNTPVEIFSNNAVVARFNSTGASITGTLGAGATSVTTLAASGKIIIGGVAEIAAGYQNLEMVASGTNANALFKNAAGASNPTANLWNATTTGDALFFQFATETSFTGRGTISYNRAGGLVAYNVTSDYRAKDIFGKYEASGETIDQLQIYLGKMKGATIARPMMIAHEAASVVPYAVTGEKDAEGKDGEPSYQSMDHQIFVPLLIAEIQSLRSRVALLETRKTEQL